VPGFPLGTVPRPHRAAKAGAAPQQQLPQDRGPHLPPLSGNRSRGVVTKERPSAGLPAANNGLQPTGQPPRPQPAGPAQGVRGAGSTSATALAALAALAKTGSAVAPRAPRALGALPMGLQQRQAGVRPPAQAAAGSQAPPPVQAAAAPAGIAEAPLLLHVGKFLELAPKRASAPSSRAAAQRASLALPGARQPVAGVVGCAAGPDGTKLTKMGARLAREAAIAAGLTTPMAGNGPQQQFPTPAAANAAAPAGVSPSRPAVQHHLTAAPAAAKHRMGSTAAGSLQAGGRCGTLLLRPCMIV
jgi:hypothetical protein